MILRALSTMLILRALVIMLMIIIDFSFSIVLFNHHTIKPQQGQDIHQNRRPLNYFQTTHILNQSTLL